MYTRKRITIILETERLILREMMLSDARDLFELNADPEVVRYTGDPPFQSIEEAEQFLKDYSDYAKNGYGRWAVIRKEDQRFIGWCGLKLNEMNDIDLGFRFFQNEWGKGYATESAYACLEYGFSTLNMDVIIGRAAKANGASIRVLEKMGMMYWKDDICHGIDDSSYFRITADTFLKEK